MDNDNLVIALSAQIQIIIALISMVKKQSVEPIALAKWWGFTLEKAQKTIQATMQRKIRTKLHPSLSRQFRAYGRNLHYHCMAYPVFSDTMFASTVFKRSNRCAQVYVTEFGWVMAFPMASEVKHMRHCCCCLLAMESQQLAHATMPRRWYKVSFMRSSKMLHNIWNSCSQILPDQML